MRVFFFNYPYAPIRLPKSDDFTFKSTHDKDAVFLEFVFLNLQCEDLINKNNEQYYLNFIEWKQRISV